MVIGCLVWTRVVVCCMLAFLVGSLVFARDVSWFLLAARWLSSLDGGRWLSNLGVACWLSSLDYPLVTLSPLLSESPSPPPLNSFNVDLLRAIWTMQGSPPCHSLSIE